MTYRHKNRKNSKRKISPNTISVKFGQYVARIIIQELSSKGINTRSEEELYNHYLFISNLISESLGDFSMMERSLNLSKEVWNNGTKNKEVSARSICTAVPR